MKYDEKEIIGKNWFNTFIPEREREQVKGVFDRLMPGEIELVESFENVVLTGKGIERIIAWHNTALRGENGNIVATLSSGEDITERKRAEEALQRTNEALRGNQIGLLNILEDQRRTEETLRQSEKDLRKIVEKNTDAIIIVDGNGVICFVNPAAEVLFGYKTEELIGNLFGFPIVVDEKTEAEIVQRDGGTRVAEMRVVEINWEKKNAYLASIRDITERKRAEETLRKSEERYRNILQSIEEGYFEVDIAGNFTFFNDALCRILGYSRDEMMGMNNRQYMDKENAQKVYQAFNQVYTTGEPHMSFDWEIIRKDGAERFIESSVSLIRDSKGKPSGFRGIVRDITERKQIEESLRESEKRYRQVVENATEIIYTVDDKGNFTYGNSAGLKVTGFSLKELQQYNYLDLVVPEYHERVRSNYMKQVRERQATTYLEFPFFNKFGKVVWFGQNASLVTEDGKIVGFHIIARDITERKRAEEALIEAEARYRTLFERVPIGLYRTAPTGEILETNPALTQMPGYPDAQSLSAINARETYANAKDRTRWQELIREKGVIQNFEKQLRCRDGSVIWVEENTIVVRDQKNKILYYEGSFQNITDRKQMEEKVRESEEHYRQLVNISPDGIALTDQSGRLMFASPRVYSIFEVPPEVSVIGMPVLEWVSPEQRDIAMDHIQKLYSNNLSSSSLEYKLLKYNGTPFWGELTSRVLVDAKGQMKGLMTLIHDITQRKRAEEEKAALQEQLRQSQKMEAIGQLAGGVAHDFNNLLTVIKGTCQLSLFDLKEDDPLKANLQEIEKSTERAANLTRQLLAFSRKQILEMQVLDLNSLIRNLEKMLHRLLGEDVELVTFFGEEIGRVKADPGQMEQVIINIAVNARDAMPQGGKLTIETANVELDGEYAKKHVSVKPGHYVMVSISDTGTGMTPEIKKRIFEPFFTTKGMGKGTGLGLSTVYGIVKQSGGNIWVYSEPGQGTTFKTYLSRVDEPLDIFKEEVEPNEIPRGNETILLVEDEEMVRKLAVKLLKKQGYKVLEAPDGRIALKLCEEHRKPIHLILSDVVLPGMSGRDLVERLKVIYPEAKALFMSGYTDNVILHHGILDRGIEFIQKPFTLDGLARKVREVLDK